METAQIEKRKSHVLNLLKLAEADGEWHENEKRFIAAVAKRVGLTEPEHEEIVFTPENIAFTPANTEEERIILLYDLLFMMKIDGVVAKEEAALCLKIGMRLGFSRPMVEEMIQAMKTYKVKKVSDHSLITIFKKYMQ